MAANVVQLNYFSVSGSYLRGIVNKPAGTGILLTAGYVIKLLC